MKVVVFILANVLKTKTNAEGFSFWFALDASGRKCTVSIRDRKKDAVLLPFPNQSRSNQHFSIGE